MPLYEYQCDGKCGQRFEKIQKFSDPPLKKCPNCGGKIHKLFSSPAIQFKGSGWYITDYAKKDSVASGKAEKAEKAAEKAEKSEKSEKSDSGSSATETKSSSDKAEKPAEKKKTSETSSSTPAKKKD